jgi:hypothetical protein
MIYTSLAVVALAASAAIPPFTNLIHLHPHDKTDSRVTVLLVNKSDRFRDVKLDGHTYTVNVGSALSVKAPIGTVIYRDSAAPFHPKGEVLIAVKAGMDHQIVDVK